MKFKAKLIRYYKRNRTDKLNKKFRANESLNWTSFGF